MVRKKKPRVLERTATPEELADDAARAARARAQVVVPAKVTIHMRGVMIEGTFDAEGAKQIGEALSKLLGREEDDNG